MKKNLLIYAAAAMTVISASAAVPTVVPKKSMKSETLRHGLTKKMRDLELKSARHIAQAKTRDSQLHMDWGYCENPYNAFQLETFTVNQAIRVAEADAETFAGASVNAILVGTPANVTILDEENWEYGNDIESVTVWLAYDLNGEHFAEAKGKFNDIAFTWTSVALDSPYIIEEGKPFYVGITYELNVLEEEGEEYSDDYGFVTDYGYPEVPNTNLIYTTVTDVDMEGEYIYADEPAWRDLADLFGNAAIRLNISGDNLPTNIVDFDDVYMPTFVAPTETLQALMYVKNLGADVVDSVDVCLEYGDGSKQIINSTVLNYDYDWSLIPTPMAYNEYGVLVVDFEAPLKEGYSDYTITLPYLNNGAANNADAAFEGTILSLADGYHKNNVVEEATGTWCGNCPMGYVGMHWLAENCEEDAIGIAMHYADPMDVLEEGHAYAPFEPNIAGYPSSFFNRNWIQDVYPIPEELEYQLETVADIPALGEIKATVTSVSDDNKTIKLDVDMEFSIADEAGNYAMAYTVVEDGVGPYRQTNYFSGEDPGTAFGFENMGKYVNLIFDDVARNCSHPTPIEGSLPEVITPGTTYHFSTEIELSDVTNLNNYRVVPMILNKKFGYVENACVAKSPTYDYSAVKSLQADNTNKASILGGKGVITISGNTDNVRIYTAAGRYVGKATGFRTSVAPGFYIVTRGNESAKVIVR
ncbi:MAG: Omp28-related outer membrane protein [Muribaculaceae bacterium]|nr:Omp28-related outer membrane protein [Muribaculaceae bacterium]